MPKFKIIFLIIPLFFNTTKSFCQNLVAYFPLDGTAVDLSVNRNNGFIFGNVTTAKDRFNNPCGAFHFDGHSGFIQVPTSSSLESVVTRFSFSAWYKLENSVNNLQWLTVFCKGESNKETFDNPQFRFQVQQSSSLTTQSCKNGTLQNGFSTISINSPVTECDYNFRDHLFKVGEWHMYTLTYDGSVLIAYMDDFKVWEQTQTFSLNKNKSPLFIGFDEPGSLEYHMGFLDDIRIFDDALSKNEIKTIFNEKRSVFIDQSTIYPANKVIKLPSSSCTTKLLVDGFDSACNISYSKQTSGPPIGSIIGKGKYRLSFLTRYLDGYNKQQTYYVDVVDVTPPVIRSLMDTSIFVDSGEKGTYVNFQLPYALDCDLKEVRVTSSLKSGDFFSTGTHKVVFVATDNSNNSSFSDFYIHVKERPRVSNPDSLRSQKDIPQQPILSIIKKDDRPARKQVEQRKIIIDSDSIIIHLLDNGQIDDDTVSVIVNGQTILYNQRLTNKPIEFLIKVDTAISNYEVSMFAENLGSIPPNTALMIIYDGKKKYEVNLTSTLQTNGTVSLIRKGKPNK
jgi:hypothetical protein